MAQSQNTVHEILVGNAIAAETTLKAFVASASAGELGIFAKDGSTLSAGDTFVIAQKTADGVIVSDIIVPTQIKLEKAQVDAPEVQKVVTVGGGSSIAVPATVGDKYEYILDIRLFNFGSLSVENFYIKHGHFILTQTGALTAETVVDGLISQLNKTFSKEPGATATSNPLFTFAKTGTGAAAALTVTAKAQTLELGKKEGRSLQFDVSAEVSKVGDDYFGVPQAAVVVTTPYDPGVGTGKKMAVLEYFFRGNRGDVMRGMNFPYNWTTKTKTNVDQALAYNLLTIVHYAVGDGLNQIQLPKQVTIAITETLSAGIDALIASYNTATGKSVAAFGEI
jgi:hypothetical protein